jgi:hypothetical protein
MNDIAVFNNNVRDREQYGEEAIEHIHVVLEALFGTKGKSDSMASRDIAALSLYEAIEYRFKNTPSENNDRLLLVMGSRGNKFSQVPQNYFSLTVEAFRKKL